LRNQAVTYPTNAVDIDVGCCCNSRTALKFGAGGRACERERQRFGIG